MGFAEMMSIKLGELMDQPRHVRVQALRNNLPIEESDDAEAFRAPPGWSHGLGARRERAGPRHSPSTSSPPQAAATRSYR